MKGKTSHIWSIARWAALGAGLGLALGMTLLLPLPEVSAEAPPTSQPTLKTAVSDALTSPAFNGAEVGVSILDCATGETLFEKDANLGLNPASNLKLVTAAVALDTLGPAYRFTTRFLADGPIDNGTIHGNLYLQGSGDPELVYEKVWKVVKDLKALGLESVEGALVVDDSYFDDDRQISGWEPEGDDNSRAYFAPLGALSFNFNTVAVVVRPGAEIGSPVKVSLETPTEYVAFDNQAKTESRGRWLQVLLEDGSDPPRLAVTGSMKAGAKPRRFYRAVPNPPDFAMKLFSELMSKEGVKVAGGGRVGAVPEGAVLIHQVQSSSLDILLKYMNKISSNFIAEQVLKTVGAEEQGAPGTTQKGLEVVREWLVANDLSQDMLLFNGSGLSQKTRVRPGDLTSLLIKVYRNPRTRWEFVSSLPIAGTDGTLKSRMRNGPAAGLVRAKTGSIDGVYAMSGYAVLDGGRMAAFSIIANGLTGSSSSVRRAMDGVIEAMIDPQTRPEQR